MILRALLASLVLSTAACASPCDRIARDLDRVNGAMLRDPTLVDDGTYQRRTLQLTADAVRHGCF